MPIKWTKDKLLDTDLSSLSDLESRRAYNRFYWQVNKTIENLQKLRTDTGMESPSLDFIETPSKFKFSRAGEGKFKSPEMLKTTQQVKSELYRLKHFIGMKTSNVSGTKQYYTDSRKEIRKVAKQAGYKPPTSISVDYVKKFWSLYRKALESYHDYDSEQLKKTAFIVYNKTGGDNFLNTIDQMIEKTGRELYEKKQDEIEQIDSFDLLENLNATELDISN